MSINTLSTIDLQHQGEATVDCPCVLKYGHISKPGSYFKVDSNGIDMRHATVLDARRLVGGDVARSDRLGAPLLREPDGLGVRREHGPRLIMLLYVADLPPDGLDESSQDDPTRIPT